MTPRGHRTAIARRPGGGAHGGPQFHERLVPIARPVPVHQLCSGSAEPCRLGILHIVEAGQHPPDIAVHRRHRLTESDARHRPCRVFPHPRKLPQLRVRSGHGTPEGLPHHRRPAMEVPSPPVVPQPLPGLEHIVNVRAGERVQVRKPIEPLAVVPEHGLHPGLLQHDLGDPDPIRIGLAAPGEVPGRTVVVAKKGLPERGDAPNRLGCIAHGGKVPPHLSFRPS